MRIVAGTAKGVRLAPVPPGVRPLADRAREGLFASLGPEALEGAVVLDLFAGTGATGIEALSRGADRASFVDRGRRTIATIRRNLALTALAERASVFTSEVSRFLGSDGRPGAPYDVVFCDPPYELDASDLSDVLRQIAVGWVGGTAPVMAFTRGVRSSTPVIPLHWAIARELRYGDSLVILIRPRDQDPPTTGPRTGEGPGGLHGSDRPVSGDVRPRYQRSSRHHRTRQ
jgi:16S rRNA (guanine966-N2)-methyltransferase